MATYVAEPLPTPRSDPTSREALARVGRQPSAPLMVSVADRCGERLLLAFLKCANATFTGKAG